MFLLRCFLPRKKATWLVQLAFLVLCFSLVGFTTPTYAEVFSASLTTSGDITVDVNTNKGAALSTDEVTVNSTCPLGYTLTVAGPTDSNLYKGGDDTASSITASTGTPSSTKPIMGESESGGVTTSYLNTWGYSLDSNTTINSNTFIGLTSTPNTLITKNTASSTSGDTLNIHYGVSVDSSKESGSYILSNNGTITYYLTTNPNCSSFKIVYNGNDDDGNTTMSVTHDNVIENDDINLYASNFIKAGYGFAGWSTEQLDPEDEDAADNLAAAVTAGHVYGPNETITADSTFLSQAKNINNVNTITLYAIWIKSTTTIQGWKGCGSMNQGDVIALTDQRDNQVYSVAKLADNNCWMIENLRLDNEYTVGQNQTDPSVTNESLAQGYATSATYGNFIGIADSETANFGDSTTANSIYYSGTQSGTATINIGTTDYPGYRFPRYNNINTHNTISDMTSPDQNVYSYGNYYTWSAAIADTTYYNVNNQSTENTSVCPSGWHLPSAGDDNNAAISEIRALGVAATGVQPNYTWDTYKTRYYNIDGGTQGSDASNKLRSFPYNFIHSGYYRDSNMTDRNRIGYYWSRTVNDDFYSYYMGIYDIGVNPGTGNGHKFLSFSVRCMALPAYTIEFDSNGGTGTMANQGVYVGETINLDANAFIAPTNPAGLLFTGWNTSADGTGTHYDDEESVTDLAASGNSITLYAQWGECPGGKICYDTNASSGVDGTMGMQPVASTDTSITLLASNYSRDGYGFAGWNTESDYTGTFYGPQEDMDFVAGTYTNKGLRLYAIWIESEGSLQDADDVATVCNGLTQSGPNVSRTIDSVSALTDERDGETYAIAKLADGKCWMIENLRLENTAAHNTDGTLAQGYGTSATAGVFVGLAEPEDPSVFADVTTSNTLYSIDGSTEVEVLDRSSAFPRYNNVNTPTVVADRPSDPITNSATNSITNAGMYSYGNYYTFAAAVARSNGLGSVSTSICPTGWSLPIGANNGRFTLLNTAINAGATDATASNGLRAFPNNFLYSGSIHSGAVNNRGSYGYYWTNSDDSLSAAVGLRFNSSSVEPYVPSFGKYFGRSIRCLVYDNYEP